MILLCKGEIEMSKRSYVLPTGQRNVLYESMLKQPHLLIGGATGSGKSVIINGLINEALYNTPDEARFILIDPKRVELIDYARLPHTLKYASEPAQMIAALKFAMDFTECRYLHMQKQHCKKWTGGQLYVIIDELADLMTTNKKQVQPLIQRLAQIGRAAGVHLIVATQCPLASVIPTEIKVNFDARVGLRTRCAQDSRNILGVKCCEELPRYGYGYYMTPDGFCKQAVPMISDTDLQSVVNYWKKQRGLLKFLVKYGN